MVPAVDSVDYGYDSRGLLSSVTSGDYVSAYDYRTNGQLLLTVHSQLSTPAGDILRTDRSYDAGARLLGVANTAANNDQAGVVYTLGVDDQRTEALEENGQKWEYGYDGLKQLVTAKKTDTSASVVPPLDQSYSSDPMGNRASYTDTTGSTAYTANSANQYTTVGGIASIYDANGNLLSDGMKNYTWDAENQLVSVTPASPVEGSQKVEYTYDWRMRRSGKKSYTYTSGAWVLTKSTGFTYHEWNPIVETITDNSQLSPDRYFYAYDGNGNVRALVKADAANPAVSAITARYAYDGFGREVAVSGADSDKNAFRFSTRQLDAESGMNYYGRRFYDANDVRWINRDPVEGSGGLNIYAMVNDDLIDDLDMNGLSVFDNLPSFSYLGGANLSVSGCFPIGGVFSLCGSGSVTAKNGLCCKDGKQKTYVSVAGGVSITVAVGVATGGWRWAYSAPIVENLRTCPSAPATMTWNVILSANAGPFTGSAVYRIPNANPFDGIGNGTWVVAGSVRWRMGGLNIQGGCGMSVSGTKIID